MGMYIYMNLHNVNISSDNELAALAAINALHTARAYAWVNNPKPPGFATLMDALAAWRYETSRWHDGTISIDSFTGEKLGADELLWNTLATFICDGAEIMCECEGDFWAWRFKDGAMHEHSGNIVYDGDEKTPLVPAVNIITTDEGSKRLQCPHCHETEIEYIEYFAGYYRLLDDEDQLQGNTITFASGAEIDWESDHEGSLHCRKCGQHLAVPDGLEVDWN